ncbi:MAG: 16S rRNA (guanine(527)-N(7))-methyltransferase RsmG [Candidatus Latescibacterota bacterium]|nr:16S rRNA (guanine(527)-N(7))-methyltransferase RsmG [Candidatus Latescibacterota bacterium]
MALASDFCSLRSGWTERSLHSLSDDRWGALEKYERLLYDWSGKMNLVSRSERNLIATRHIWRGLALARLIEARAPRTIIDVGSGAGIPGVPIKICLPDVEIYLVESRRKRANFLRTVVRELALKRIHVVNERIENWDNGVSADIFTARAVAQPNILQNLLTNHTTGEATLVCTLSKDVEEGEMASGEIRRVTWGGQSMKVGLFPMAYQQ